MAASGRQLNPPPLLREVVEVFRELKITTQQVKIIMFLLGVPLSELDSIQQSNSGNEEIAYVGKWLDLDVDASWGKIVKALEYLQMGRNAKQLQTSKNALPAVLSRTDEIVNTFLLLFDLTLKDMYTLFLTLEVPRSRLEGIKCGYHDWDRSVHYIDAWYSYDCDPTAEKLIAALHKIGQTVVAENLSKSLAQKQAVRERQPPK